MLRFLSLLIFFQTALAEAKLVNRIFIIGNHVVESSVIRSHISLKKRRPYRASSVQKDVKNLFSLGFFDDIEVRTRNVSKNKLNVTYIVKERQIIKSIKFVGNKNVNTDEIKEISLIKKGQFLNFDKLRETFSKIKDIYKEKGYFLADLSYKMIPVKKDKKAKLIIQIKENQKMLIKRIQFIGNRQISAETIKKFIRTKEQNITSFFGSSGVYNPEVLEGDLQMIEYYYRDKGYLKIRLNKPEVSVTPDRKGIYISISVKEGSRFRIGQIEFKGDDIVSKAVAMRIFELKTRKYFSLGALQRDIQRIQNLYKEKSYAFAEIQPHIVPDQGEDNTVHILFNVTKGSSYKLGRIEIKGNYKTRDKVILRQISLREGSPYMESQKQISAGLIQRLGFFEKVDLQLKKRNSNTVDLHVDLEERERTGEAQVGGGYNSVYGVILKAGVKENNFLGLGHSISLQIDVSRFQELFNLNYSNSYFLDSNWSFGFDAFNVGQDLINGGNLFSQNQRFLSYSQLNTGSSISFGRHFSRFLAVFLKYRLQKQSLSEDSFSLFQRISGKKTGFFGSLLGKKAEEIDTEVQPEKKEKTKSRYVNFTDIYPLSEGEGINSSVSGILEYDRRNDRFFSTKGYYSQLSFEYSGLAGDFDYTKIKANLRHYKNLFWKFTLRNNLNYGIVFSNDEKKKVPFTELFLLGGPDSLRGFSPFSVGTRLYSQQAFNHAKAQKFENPERFAWRPYGNTQMFYWNVEIQFPIIQASSIDGVLFFDAGEVSDKLSFNFSKELRADVGVGIRWRSPFGPIRLDWGFPLKPKREFGENKMEFQFSMGSSF